MPKPPKAVHTGEAKSRGQHSVGKLRLYEILFSLNQGFEQVLGQLQQLEKFALGKQPCSPRDRGGEPRRGQLDWSSGSPSANREAGPTLAGCASSGKRSFEIPKTLIEADRLRQQLKTRWARRRGTPQQ